MNIAVGIISEEARTAIEAVGGSIKPTLKPDVLMVSLPDGATIEDGGTSEYVHISLPGPGGTLYFKRAWHTEQCSLDLCH